ncbi:hypothetical protein [Pelagimonas varians]|uniref:Uncharacterized protein n=1 Tax=Pelagimonas varians TaxID=696760 RepID=A0A238JU66_9RHOB|nr:hypothetical protein [Pelagimonas varians]PYG34424.1 hypothetical protein C8N36_10174 [Pelagimonas varians]SMX34115.1 hypothetical protein PEV8663_00392 [Pelagimonas varians]
MPVTSFALLLVSVIAAAAVTVMAVSAWGVVNVLPVLLIVALLARWGLAHVPFDDSHS